MNHKIDIPHLNQEKALVNPVPKLIFIDGQRPKVILIQIFMRHNIIVKLYQIVKEHGVATYS